MRKLLIFLIILFPLAGLAADIDTKDGVAVTTGSSFDGCSGTAKYDGQTIKAATVGSLEILWGYGDPVVVNQSEAIVWNYGKPNYCE
jgi:hypothetical protein